VKKALVGLLGLTGFSFSFVGGEVSLELWNQDPKGYIQYPADLGTPLDLDEHLRLGDETRFSGKVKLELPSFFPNLYFAYTNVDFSGSGYAEGVRFGDYVFNATVNTTVKANQYDLGFYYHLPFVKNAFLDPEVGLVLKVVDFEATVSGRATLANNPAVSGYYSETVSETVPLPLLYLHLGVYPLPYAGLLGEFKGLKVGDDYFYEYSVALRITPLSFSLGKPFLQAGYRYQRIRLKDVGDTNADVRVGGFYGGIGLSF